MILVKEVSTIRKILIPLVAFLMSLFLVACNGERLSEQSELTLSKTEDTFVQTPTASEESGIEVEQSLSEKSKTEIEQNSSGKTCLEDVNSMLESLEEVMGSLDDVTSEDLDIPKP
ncbi:MAG: hypothetical protein WBJ13_00155 [Sedimentibacter sp.]